MIPSERAHLHVAAITDAGISGKNNEDRFGVSAFQLETPPQTPALLAIVADGIGGHRAGEVASEMAVELISRFIAASDGSQPELALQEAIVQAGHEISITAEMNKEQHGMGSTCACTLIIGDRLYTATVGDSRIFLIRGHQIRQLSTDHTWIQEALDNGSLTQDQARNHPNAHVIRRYLGSRQAVVPDMRLRLSDDESDAQAKENQGLRLLPGDSVVLCSDGLTDLISDDEIYSYIKNKKSNEALDDLVAIANKRGGHDNITIIAIRVPDETRVPPPPEPIPQRRTRSNLSCIVGGVIIVLTLVLLGWLAWYFDLLGGQVEPTPTATETAIVTDLPLFPTETGLPTEMDTLTATPESESPTVSLPTATRTAGIPPPPVDTLTPWPTNTSSTYP